MDPASQLAHVATHIPDRTAFATDLSRALLHEDLSLDWQRRIRRSIAALGPPAAPAVLACWLNAPDRTAPRAYVALTSLLPDAGAWHAEGDPFAGRWTEAHRTALAPYESDLLERLRAGKGTRRMHAGWILGAFPPEARSPRSLPWLVDAFVQPQEEELRRVAAHALMASAALGKDVVPRLWSLLDGPDADVRDMAHAILIAWGRTRPEVADRFATRLVRAAAGRPWRQAVTDITQLGPLAGRAAPALVAAWQGAQGADQDRARQALRHLGARADDALLTLALTGTSPWQERAVDLLAAVPGPPSAIARQRMADLPEAMARRLAPRLARPATAGED